MLKDRNLIIKIKKGDIASFKKLIEKYQKPFYSFIYKIVNEHESTEDILQETFFKIYKSIEKIDLDRKFSTYGFEIAKNTAISYLRKRKKEVSINDLKIPIDESNYENLIKNENKDMVNVALSKLDKKYKSVLDLYYIKEMQYKEISKILKLPLNTVRTRLKRGKKMLEIELKKHEK